MNRKKRVLIVNEFSVFSTGFATYMNEVIKRLYKSGKYEIAELACYVDETHKNINSLPWKVYPNQPHPQNQEAARGFNAVRANVFGRWRFDEVCLDFKPDYVLMIRDYWMDFWIQESPLRKRFNLINMPTVDGEPQKEEWVEFYKDCERVMTYSHFGKSVLERQSGGAIKVFDVASPGADLDLFFPPENKHAHKESMGIRSDAIIFQTVMRNQPRKLFPDLMKAFSLYLQKMVEFGHNEKAQLSYLWLHTSQPDVGWDIGEEIKRHNLSHKVLLTYRCERCGHYFPSFWSGERCFCSKCGHFSCSTPNSMNGLERKDLAKVMQCADVYIQHSISEGDGMPIKDAKACGIPVIVTDYSAMIDHARSGGGLACRVGKFFQETITQTDQVRALPDNDHCAELMTELIINKGLYEKLSKEARETVENNYNWNRVADCWMRAIDTLPIKSGKDSWEAPYVPINPQANIPETANNSEFVRFFYQEILKDPNQFNTIKTQKKIAALNNGYAFQENDAGQRAIVPYTREKFIEEIKNTIDQYNRLEYLRCHKPQTTPQDKNNIRMVVI